MEPSDPGITMLEVDMEDLLSEKCKNTPNFATNARRVRFDMSEPPATRSATKSGMSSAKVPQFMVDDPSSNVFEKA